MNDKLNEKLIKVTKKLGKHHQQKGKAERMLKKDRLAFFKVATEEQSTGDLAQKTVAIPIGTDIEEWVSVYHPGWLLVEATDGTAILKEDPSLVSFRFVNPEDNMVYWRNVVPGAPSFDDEAFVVDHPDLWMQVSDPIPMGQFTIDVLRQYNKYTHSFGGEPINVDDWIRHVTAQPDWPRTLRPLDELSDEQASIVQDYIVPGPISLRLEQPRPVKEDDE